MGYKILIADDDTNICDLLKIYLENEGYETVTAYDGIKALSAFKIYEPDLVLLDIMMPRKDGWQVCREIREMSSKPIIMVTAKGEVFDKVLGLELGADDFITKPFDMIILRSACRNTSLSSPASRWIFPRRNWSFSTSLPPTTTAFSHATSCLTRFGASITSATAARWMYTLSVFAKS